MKYMNYGPKITFFCLIIMQAFGTDLVNNLQRSVIISDQIFKDFKGLVSPSNNDKTFYKSDTIIPLFAAYPTLIDHISYVSLANLPTPITRCATLENHLPLKNLYIKRDDLTGKNIGDMRLFGGNKVRKLEFLLADALAHNAQRVITFGCVGSNHALATAVYCNELGLECQLMLKPQWNSHIVRRNLLLDLHCHSLLMHYPTHAIRSIATVHSFYEYTKQTGSLPYVIPTGGSCPLGILGYVNAAFELKEQIEAGIMPTPDRIYSALGSAGTVVGLLIGLKAANITTQLHAITVEPGSEQSFSRKIKRLFEETITMLHTFDTTFPLLSLNEQDCIIDTRFAGKEYALFTLEAVDAMQLFNETEGIVLDGVYSGKAFSALLHDCYEQDLSNETILFWNTFCADDFSSAIASLNYQDLPSDFHKYFENDVQELDRIYSLD